MKQMLLTLALLVSGLALFAEPLWDGDLSCVSLQSGKKLQDVSVKTEDGALLITGTSEGSSVTYINVEIRIKPVVLNGRILSMELFSDDPKTTETVYVRAQNARKQNILSFQRWGSPLKEKPQKFMFIPGVAQPYMKWEPTEVKAPVTDPIDRILIFIGARGDGKPLSIKVKNIQFSDDTMPKLPNREGTILSAAGNECMYKAVQNGNTVTVDSLTLANHVVYTYAKVPFTGDLTGKKLVFSGTSASPEIIGAFYVRGYNAKRECILSYSSWNYLLKGGPKTFTLTPGQDSSGLNWEAPRVKAGADQNLAQLEFIIGTNKNANKLMQAEFKDIKLQ